MRLLMLGEARTVHLRRWATALLRRGWQVVVLSVSETALPDVEIIPLETPPPGLTYPRRWWGRYAQYVRSTIRRVAPDVVHIHYLTDYPLSRGAGRGSRRSLRRWSSRPPLVISTWGADIIQDQWVQRDSAAQRERKVELLQTADAVTATTCYLADRTAEYGGIRREAITVIPFGVDLARYSTSGPPRAGREPVVGFLKHLEPKYGLEHFLRAMPRILQRFPATRFPIIGTGSQRDSLADLGRSLGLDDHLEWRGAIDHDQVPAALADMDVYVMPSVSPSETFGVSAVEAAASAVAVVFSDLPGVREAVTDGVGGLAVPPGDSEALAEAIIRLLADEPLRRRLGEGGRRWANERFDFEDNVTQMEKVYRRATCALPCAAT